MRSFLRSLLVAAITLLAIGRAAADPAGDVAAMGKTFAGVRSFHADIVSSKGNLMSLDVIQPDKMHMTMNGKTQVIKIAGDTWMNLDGQWQHMSMPAPMMQRPMEMARNVGLEGKGSSDYTITDDGLSLLDGMSTHKYHMVSKTDGQIVEMWTKNDLPVQVQMPGKDGLTTIRYSQYNGIPDITPPA